MPLKAQEFYAIDGHIDTDDETKQFVVYGGGTAADALRYRSDRSGTVAVVLRMDLDQNTIRWARTFDVLNTLAVGIQSKYVTALSINPAGDKVAVHVSEDIPTKGTLESMIFVIRTADGGHVTKQAMHIKHDTFSKFLLQSSSSLYYTGDDTVLMALTIDYDQGPLMKCGDGLECDSRMRIASFNVQNENFDFYKEQDKFFGQSTSLAYGHFDP